MQQQPIRFPFGLGGREASNRVAFVHHCNEMVSGVLPGLFPAAVVLVVGRWAPRGIDRRPDS